MQILEFKRNFLLTRNEGALKVVDDMITLDEINEPIILNNIRLRYLQDQIYARLSFVLILSFIFK